MQKSTGNHVSCCVAVHGVERNLFVLPRVKKLDGISLFNIFNQLKDNGDATEEDVTMGDVYQEFDELRKKCQVSQFASKPVSRQYAFELAGIPAESEYLKVLYPFSDPEIPSSSKGKTFSHIFGTKTSALELFLLKRKLMGPSWVKVTGVEKNPKNVTFNQRGDSNLLYRYLGARLNFKSRIQSL